MSGVVRNGIMSSIDAMQVGDQNLAHMALRAIKALYDPEIPFNVTHDGDRGLTTSSQLIVSSRPLKVSLLTGSTGERDFLFRLSPNDITQPIELRMTIKRGVWSLLSGFMTSSNSPANEPRILWYQDASLPVGPDFQLAFQPNALPNRFSKGKIVSGLLTASVNQTTNSNLLVLGTINGGTINDLRDTAPDGAQLASISEPAKNKLLDVPAIGGFTAIFGPEWSPLRPLNRVLLAGDGDAGISANVLLSPIPFNQVANVNLRILQFPPGAALNTAGIILRAANLDNVYDNSVYIGFAGTQFVLSSTANPTTQGNPRIININPGSIGFGGIARYTVTLRVPASTGLYQTQTIAGAAHVVFGHPYLVMARHFYGQTTGSGTLITTTVDTISVPTAIANSSSSFSRTDSMFIRNDAAGVINGNFLCATSLITVDFEPDRLAGYEYLGTLIQAVDHTIYPAATGTVNDYAGGYPNGTALIGGPTPTVWDVCNYSSGAMFRIDGDTTTLDRQAPWWAHTANNQAVMQALLQPQVMGISVTAVRLYDEAIVPSALIRLSQVGPDQQLTVSAQVQLSLVETGDQTQYSRSTGPDERHLLCNDDVIKAIQRLWSDNSVKPLKRLYTQQEFMDVAKAVAKCDTLAELFEMVGGGSDNTVVALQSSGIFGSMLRPAISMGMNAFSDARPAIRQRFGDFAGDAADAIYEGVRGQSAGCFKRGRHDDDDDVDSDDSESDSSDEETTAYADAMIFNVVRFNQGVVDPSFGIQSRGGSQRGFIPGMLGSQRVLKSLVMQVMRKQGMKFVDRRVINHVLADKQFGALPKRKGQLKGTLYAWSPDKLAKTLGMPSGSVHRITNADEFENYCAALAAAGMGAVLTDNYAAKEDTPGYKMHARNVKEWHRFGKQSPLDYARENFPNASPESLIFFGFVGYTVRRPHPKDPNKAIVRPFGRDQVAQFVANKTTRISAQKERWDRSHPGVSFAQWAKQNAALRKQGYLDWEKAYETGTGTQYDAFSLPPLQLAPTATQLSGPSVPMFGQDFIGAPPRVLSAAAAASGRDNTDVIPVQTDARRGQDFDPAWIAQRGTPYPEGLKRMGQVKQLIQRRAGREMTDAQLEHMIGQDQEYGAMSKSGGPVVPTSAGMFGAYDSL